MFDELWKDFRTFATVPNVLLTSLLLLGAWVLNKAQKNPSFEISHMLVDERGKPSSSRLAVFVAIGMSSYLLAYVVTNNKISDEYLFYFYLAFLLTWASSKGLEKFAVAITSRFAGNSGQQGNESKPVVVYSQSCPVPEEKFTETAQTPSSQPKFTPRSYSN